MTAAKWDFPFWVAHRGAGKLAPENTLAAFRVGSQHGYRAFECDVKLTQDGQLYLLHDATLKRTTSARQQLGEQASADAHEHTWATLSTLDAGSWHSRAHAGEPLPTLGAVLRYARANGARLNLEIKPSPGMSDVTGAAVAKRCAAHFAAQADWPLLSSFDTAALAAAQREAAHIPRGLLIDVWRDSWLDEAKQLGCAAIIFNYTLWGAERVAQAHAAGFKALSYTVNDEWSANWLIGLGTDGIITDRVDLFSPA